jgi:hypothetical protein
LITSLFCVRLGTAFANSSALLLGGAAFRLIMAGFWGFWSKQRFRVAVLSSPLPFVLVAFSSDCILAVGGFVFAPAFCAGGVFL